MIKMKLKYIIFGLFVCLLASCDFMDCDESSDYAEGDIFTSYNRTKQMVTHIYSFLPNGFCNIDGAMHEAATDDAVHVYGTSKIQRFVDGTWSPNRTVDEVWSKYYEGIRSANLYLTESEGQTFEEWKYSDQYDKWMQNFENYQYEVRFLRAFFYFELAKRYRNVPLVTKVLTVDEANHVEQSSFEEVTDYIVNECAEIAYKLPVDYSGFADKEDGRITRGAALALKARVLLYKASPLYSAHDDEKWKNAAKAAYEIIGQASALKYKLGDYAALFSATNSAEAENILVRPVGETGSFEQSNFPMGVKGGKTSTCPTENLVSAYEMQDGSAFDWNNEEMRKNPYANRDPRLTLTIAYNGMSWPQSPLEIWEGGANALPINNATLTGYYLKKYVNNDISFESGAPVTEAHHCWVLFRYGEVLLNYAEAMVNAFGDPTYKEGTLMPMSALEAVNLIRKRTSVNMPEFPATLSPDEFLKRLKNERRIELAFEGHRFWDVRRWKELDSTKNIYGVSVKKQNNVVIYGKQQIATRVVKDNMYFYPISNEEIFINKNLDQNTGWK